MTSNSVQGRRVPLALVIAACVAGGYLVRFAIEPAPQSEDSVRTGVAEAPAVSEVWSCAMDPQVRRNGPGLCPICGMELVKLESSSAGGDTARLVISQAARDRARIETSPVERRAVLADIRMVGKVTVDETRRAHITAWAAGRVERVYADYTGVSVEAGEHLLDLFSSSVLTAEAQLLLASAALAEHKQSGNESLVASARGLLDDSRERLLNFGLTPEQIAAVEARGTIDELVTVYAPIGGIVTEKHVTEGAFVETGSRLYTIDDLSHVWVKLEAYESDLAWLRYGQKVSFTTQAYPGEEFHGTIAFIDPVLDARTRTVKVRVNVPNDGPALKPEMFVRAVVRAEIAGGGRVLAAELAGKWICTMHPEIVADGAGDCGLCEMPLVPAESLGYVVPEHGDADLPLVIPATAPLLTGKRAIVYVEAAGEERTYEGREVVLGPRAGDWYLVASGLAEGELVVTRGNFKIDSALQILARPSMMSVEETPVESGPLVDVTSQYAALWHALVESDLAAAQSSLAPLVAATSSLASESLAEQDRARWASAQPVLAAALAAMEAAEDLELMRVEFSNVSEALVEFLLESEDSPTLSIVRCPMALDGEGARWLQPRGAVENPYYGASMLRCGSVESELGGSSDR